MTWGCGGWGGVEGGTSGEKWVNDDGENTAKGKEVKEGQLVQLQHNVFLRASCRRFHGRWERKGALEG